MRRTLRRIRTEQIFFLLGSCAVAGLLMCLILHVPLRSKQVSAMHSAERTPRAAAAIHEEVLKIAQAAAERAEIRNSKQILGPKEILSQAFKRCDTDGSLGLSRSETEACVQQQVTLHLTQAIRENFFIFTALDVDPRNGEVSWQEHLTHFLRKRGYDADFIAAHLDNLKDLKREEKESIMRDKAAWSEAARSDPDTLTLDEFLAFHHPESSHGAILAKVEELLYFLDTNGDGALTKEEYCQSNQGAQLTQCLQERFLEVDQNADGKIERRELVLYRDPRHPHHSRLEADRLFAAADTDADGSLSLPELLTHSSLFVSSKMVDVAGSFHNEF